MLFDTDILIWYLRGKLSAARLIDRTSVRCTSVINFMELIQGARSRNEVKTIKEFFRDYTFEILPLNDAIGHRASVYMEEYALSHGLRVADALIAATATDSNIPLVSANKKHFEIIADLQLRVYRPE